MSNLLPHGVKRHLQSSEESAEVICMMLASGKAVSTGEISHVTNLSNYAIMSRLVRMRDLGIVDMHRMKVSSKWSIPVSFQEPLKQFMDGGRV